MLYKKEKLREEREKEREGERREIREIFRIPKFVGEGPSFKFLDRHLLKPEAIACGLSRHATYIAQVIHPMC